MCHVDPNKDMFALGVTSLQSAQLVGTIKYHSGKVVTLAQLHASPTLESLAALLQSSDEDSTDAAQTTRWAQDSHLADDLVPRIGNLPKRGTFSSQGRLGLSAHTYCINFCPYLV